MLKTGRQWFVLLLAVLLWPGSHVRCSNFNDYPDPQIDFDQCGNANQRTWICDPTLTFSTSQYQAINGILVDIQNGDKCACGQVSCGRSFVVSVAIVGSISTFGNNNQETATQEFADYLRRDGWNEHGECNENVVIVYNTEYKIIAVAVGPAARETLQDECSEDVLEETRAVLQREDAFNALSFMIKEFREYLGGLRICRSRPNAGGDLDLLYIAWIVLGLFGIISIVALIICCFRRCYGPQDRRMPKKKKNPTSSEEVGRYEAGVFGLNNRVGIAGPEEKKLKSALKRGVHPHSNNPPLVANDVLAHPNQPPHGIPNGGQPYGLTNGGPYGVPNAVLQNGGPQGAYPGDIKVTQHDGGITVLELGDVASSVPTQPPPVNQQTAVGFAPTTTAHGTPYTNQQQQLGFAPQAPTNVQFQNPALQQNFPQNPGIQNAPPPQLQVPQVVPNPGPPPVSDNAASLNYATLDLQPPRQLGPPPQMPPQMTQIDPPSLTLASGSVDTAAISAQATVASYSDPAHNLPAGIFGNRAGNNPPGQVPPTGNPYTSARPRHNFDTVRDHNPDLDAEMAFGDDQF